MVIGHTHGERILFEPFDLEVLGQPHRSYGDMPPLPANTTRETRWRVVVAHGHYVPAHEWQDQAHRSWKFGDDDLDALNADYIALGHWDRNEAVGAEHAGLIIPGRPISLKLSTSFGYAQSPA